VSEGDVERTLAVLRDAGEAPCLIGEIVPLAGAAPRSGELVLGADGSQLLG
jgi:hypothetical protein